MLHEGSEVHCVAGRYSNPILSDCAAGSVWLEHQSPEAIKVRELSRAAASALGMTHGFGHCEVFRDRSGRWLVGEFASRPGGVMIPRSLQLSYGIDNMALLADQLAGCRPAIEPGNHARGTIAWLAVPVESGTITDMPDEEQLLSLPGVIEAEIVMRPGDSSKVASSMYSAAYVFCIGDNPQEAEELAKNARERAASPSIALRKGVQ